MPQYPQRNYKMFRKLRTIIWKNLVIRKRHWLLTAIEIVIPILLFGIMAYARSKISGFNKVYVKEATYKEIHTLEDIYLHLDVGELNLLYAPNTSDINHQLIKNVQEKLQIRGDAIQHFETKEELLKNFGKNSTLVALVNFKSNLTQHLDYDLTLYSKYFLWNTNKLFASVFTFDDMRSSTYLHKGYAALQVAIDMSYLELHSNENLADIHFSVQEFPDPPRTVDSGLSQLFMYFLPLITIFSFIFLCPAVLQRVGEEKHSGTKEFMKMIGMSSWVIWLGWFIHALITSLFSVIAIVVLMKVPLWGVEYPPIEFSDPTVLFVFLFLYCMATITFCFFIGSIFNTPSVASVVGILIWLFSYFIPQAFIRSHENLLWNYKISLAIFPNVALYFGYSSISVFEMREVGIHWNNIFEPSTGSENDVTMGNVFIVLIVDMILFMLLSLYLENVKPGEYGIPKSYFFPITNLKNWITKNRRVENSSENNSLNCDVEQGKVPFIEIHNLRKKFQNHLAVEDLNMNIYQNQITVLLGHNGAGKTTVMSILTGMISATNGCIKVGGKDINKHTNDVRKLMGLCPQHNLIFPDLTVKEHLLFFAKLKELPNPSKSVEDILKKLGIEDTKDSLAHSLSGGTQRKLCLGMALIGDSEVLILDEPTSGMDPESRRKIWDLLLTYKKSRTIFITTHFMEEADILGDWVAIMANGRLQCYDTPLRLKTRYDTGYHLSLLVKNTKHVEEITSAIQNHVEEAKVIREIKDTLVFLLPLKRKSGTRYRDLCNVLETNKNRWNIVNIGLNLTTLNDVFLKVKDEIDRESNIEINQMLDEDFLKYPTLEGTTRSSFYSIYSIVYKRFQFLKKKFHWFIPSIVVALCSLILMMWLGASDSGSKNGEPPLNLTLQIYGKTQVYYGGATTGEPKVNKMKIMYKENVVREQGNPVLEEDVLGGIIQMGINNIAFYKNHMIAASEFNYTSDNQTKVNALYSSNSWHGLPISINLAMNALVKTLINETCTISTTNVPQKPLHSEHSLSEMSVVGVLSIWLILMPLGAFFLTSNFIIFPHTEVSTNFMQLQTFIGIRTYVYWLSNLLFDVLLSLLLIISVFCIVYLFSGIWYDSLAFQIMDIGIITVIFFWYTTTSMPFTYLFSYRKTLTGGFTLFLMIGIFIGIVPTIIVTAMELSRLQYYIKISEYLKHILFAFFPPFSLSYIIAKFTRKYVENFNWKYMDPNKRDTICRLEKNPCCFNDDASVCHRYQNYFMNNELGLSYDFGEMIIPFVIYFMLLLIIPTGRFQKILHYMTHSHKLLLCKFGRQEPKVANDDERYQSINKDYTLLVKNLTKKFGRETIVKNLKLQLQKKKCFGLLGVNGAGKTTTFRMLTKNLFFDEGEITVSEEQPISIDEQKYGEKIGYCPQKNCLNYFLSGKELLYSLACLKGYSHLEATNVTEKLLQRFELDKYADKACSNYSGGNKRKLCTCIAFLGLPTVVLLDEPTTGVDPASRRNFWDILLSLKNTKDTSVLLCSHSMEECEVLCDEIAIMKSGEIKDQGSLLSLKNKYQNGFNVNVKLKSSLNDDAHLIKNEVISRLNADVVEEYEESLTYKVKHKNLSQIFDFLEDLKGEKNCIEDYTINQISLEDVFLSVANQQRL